MKALSTKCLLIGIALLAWVATVTAQSTTSTTSSSSSSGTSSSRPAGAFGSNNTSSSSSGGTSFSGGNAFSGGTSSSGGNSSTGNSFTGGNTSTGGNSFGGGNTGRTGGTTAIVTAPGTTNPFKSYYGNPLSLGLPTNTSGKATFGTTLYTVTNTATTTTSTQNNSSNSNAGGSSVGVRRAAQYLVSSGLDPSRPPGAIQPPRTIAPQLRADLQSIITQSDTLASRQTITVGSDAGTVVLTGTVADAHERRLAEAMIRLSPGVRDVRNELQVKSGP